MLHICITGQVNIGLDNGFLPILHQAIIQTNDGFTSITPQGTGFNDIIIETEQLSLTKLHLKSYDL